MEFPIRKITESQNLLKDSQPERIPLPRSFWKFLGLEIVSIVLAAATGVLFARFAAANGALRPVLVALAAYLAASFLRTLFSESRGRRTLDGVLEAAALTAPLVGTAPLPHVLAAGFIAALFLLSADMAARRQYENSIKFRFLPLARMRTGRAFSGILLAGLILFLPHWQTSENLVPERQFGEVYGSAAVTARTVAPSVDLTATIGQFIRDLVQEQSEADSEFAKLPPDRKERELDAAAAAMLADAERSLGIPLRPDMRLEEAFRGYANSLFASWRESLGSAFGVFWLIVLFILLRGVGVTLVFISVMASLLAYEVLSALGFSAVLGETRTKENIMLT